jgi:hypothetical protein
MKKVSTGAISMAVATAILLSGCGAKPAPQIMTKSDAIKKMEVMKFDKEKELYSSSALPTTIQMYGPFGTGESGRSGSGRFGNGSKEGIVFQEADGSYILKLSNPALASYAYDAKAMPFRGYKDFNQAQVQEVLDRLPSYKFDSIVAGDLTIPVKPGQSSFRLPKNADISDIKVVFKIDKLPKVYEPFDQKSKNYAMGATMLVLTVGFAAINPNFWKVVKSDHNEIQNYVNEELKSGAEKITIHANTKWIEDPKGQHCYRNNLTKNADGVEELECSALRKYTYFKEPVLVSKLPLNCKSGIIDDDLGISAKDVSGGQCTDQNGLQYQSAISEFERFLQKEKRSRELTKK